MTATQTVVLGTRAALRSVEPGNDARCQACGQPIKFQANVHHRKRRQVIVNIYGAARDRARCGERRALPPGRRGVWDRVEHFHPDCYDLAGQPHGDPGSFVAPGDLKRNMDAAG